MKDALQRRLISSIYRSVLASDATYIGEAGTEKPIRILYREGSAEYFAEANVGVKGSQITMRVRLSDVEKPIAGDVVVYCGSQFTVDDYDRQNRLEWLLYVVA